MRILQIINNLGSGGAEKLISDIAPLMNGGENTTDVVLLRRKGSIYIETLQRTGVSVKWFTESSLYSPMVFIKLCVLLYKGGYDVVHAHIFPVLYWVALAKWCGVCKSRLIYTEHSTLNRRRNYWLFNNLDRWAYRQYNSVICITEEVMTLLVASVPAVRTKSVVVHNGVDLNSYAQPIVLQKSKIIPNFDSSMHFVTMVGRFSKAKDQKTMIRALSLLPDRVHLLLVGEGPLKGECEALVSELELANRVHFLGIRMDVPDILRLSDIGVLSSHWDGFGIAAVESMAAGLPTIGSNVSGLSSVIGNAGLLFSQGDHQQLARCIERFLSDTEHYKAVAHACRMRASLFSIEKLVVGYEREYRK